MGSLVSKLENIHYEKISKILSIASDKFVQKIDDKIHENRPFIGRLWQAKGVLLVEFMGCGTTINSNIYYEI